MAGRDWSNLGDDLSRIVEDAVNMRNFGRLNEDINKTIDRVFGGYPGEEKKWQNSPGEYDFNLSGKGSQPKHNRDDEQKRRDSGEVYGRGTESAGRSRSYSYAEAEDGFSKTNGRIFASSGRRKAGPWVMLICGVLLSVFSLVILGLLSVGAFMIMSTAIAGFMGMFGIFLVIGAVLAVKGGLALRLSKRFDQHVRNLEGEAYADIKKLSAYCHRSEKEVLREIKKMIKKGWFPQGHLDNSEKCLMVTNEAYEQYLFTIKNARMQEEERKRKQKEEAKKNGGLSAEVREVLRKGNEYIESIRKSNDAIPGEEISEKIYRMELLVKRIFQQTEAHPENVEDLDKLMEYYLPMTVKLLNAYEELDGQPIQGENIINSKKEIENTLDTLNKAFGKMLDNLFEDTAWDVSSDISVLESLLAQEGLTDDGFAGGRGRK